MKNSKHSRSAGEIEDYYNELCKYSRSQPTEAIAERIKKNRNWNQNLNSKKTMNQIFSIISTIRSWK